MAGQPAFNVQKNSSTPVHSAFNAVRFHALRPVDYKTVLFTAMQNDLFLPALEQAHFNPNLAIPVVCKNLPVQRHKSVVNLIVGAHLKLIIENDNANYTHSQYDLSNKNYTCE